MLIQTDFSKHPVKIPAEPLELEGDLSVAQNATGLVIFSHGSGSSRHSPRNQYVALQLQSAGMGSLLLDLLSPDEDNVYATRFDIDLLTERLIRAVLWAASNDICRGLPVGLFGSSTGAASALRAAALLPDTISAAVSRGGRPDLASASLERVICPCLLIVGENDQPVIPLNQQAFDLVSSSEKHLTIVRGASHLFEEKGALEKVAHLATLWFSKYLRKGST